MSNTQNKFPIGIDDFRMLLSKRDNQTNQPLYIDKTLFIRDILDSGTLVSLFTRPRRFGKTLILSMLEHFFSAEVNGEATAGMFDDLKIAAYQEHMKHQGQYPVIFITFKDVQGKNFSLILYEILDQIKELYSKHEYLLDSPHISTQMKKYFNQVSNEELEEQAISSALKKLSQCLYQHHKKRVIVLIDEYDSPIHSAYNNNYYSDCINFMRPLLSKVLKNNSALQFGVVTGILRVAKESIFSGLNNLGVHSVMSNMYSEYFGFTEAEVNYLISQSDIKTLDRQKIKETYNGYKFGQETIYNPWSIVNCLDNDGEINRYWVNTADSTLIKNFIAHSNNEIVSSFNKLIQGEAINMIVREDMVFPEMQNNATSVYNFLLMTGYLTIDSKKVSQDVQITAKARIPNHEINGLYKDIITGWLNVTGDPTLYENFLKDLITGKIEEFIKTLKRITSQILSYFDVSHNKQESFYHGLMLGIASGVTSTHEVRSNRESGSGRYDLMIIPKDVKQYPLGIVMEFKFVKDEAQIEEAAQQALTQIESKNYTQELEARGIKQIIKIGIGFAGKKVAVKYIPQK